MHLYAEAPLDPTLLGRFNNWFQEDLSFVRILLYPSGRLTPHVYQPRAFTNGSDIYLADSIFDYTAPQAEFLLAHEFAHVVQKMRGQNRRGGPTRRSLGEIALEREASLAATAFSAGLSCPLLSSDDSSQMRSWGPAGHYYSVYFIARFAGLPDATSEHLAFYAQMPDQVADLDAIVAGEGFAVWALLPPAHRKAAMVPVNRIIAIAKGLHCLTGNPGKFETDWRIANLKRIPHPQKPRGQFAFGLGLHALGDSYAHRIGDGDSAEMYSAPFGHLFGGTGFAEKVWKQGKEVDNIAKRSSLYKQYCVEMLGIISQLLHPLNPTVLAAKKTEVTKMVDTICSEPGEDAQIRRLRNFYPDKSDSYAPETESSMLWQEFLRRHPKQTSPWMMEDAQRLIAKWS